MTLLAFVGGVYVAERKVFPYSLFFRDAFVYMRAIELRKITEAEVLQAQLDAKVQGVTVPATIEAFPGYTFFTLDATQPSTACLIDMEGKIVHTWHRPLRDIWPSPPHRAHSSADAVISWRYAELMPNGDIIAVIKVSGDTPEGYGLVKLDKDSNVIWAIADNFHHHFSIASDGRIFATTHQWRDTRERPVAHAPQLPALTMEDFVVEISPDGKELSRVSLLDAIVPEFSELLQSAFSKGFNAKPWDPLHTNDAEIIEADFAAHHPFMKAGMVMVSMRDLDTIALLDMQAKRVTWALRGPWVRQHDPDFLPNGNVLIFDNRGHRVGKGGSRIIEFEPGSNRIVWSYSGSTNSPFYTDIAGGQERLPNGNVLITEDKRGRIFEVTPGGQIVWAYRSDGVKHASRVSHDQIQFALNGPAKTIAKKE